MATFKVLMQQISDLRASLSTVTEEARRATERMRELREVTREYENGANQLDDLLQRLGNGANVWAQEMKMQLELVQLGMMTLEDFMSMWGDAVFQTEQGSRTIRELLEGMDMREYLKRVQELAEGLQDGAKSMADVLDYLRTVGGTFSQEMIKAIEAFQQGKITLQRLREIMQSISDNYTGAGGEFDELVKAILQGLQSGSL
jgi:uncharacterized phage infection (PIP) family protein YhgE